MKGRSAADASKAVLDSLLKRKKTRPKAGNEASVAVRIVIVTPPWPSPEPAIESAPASAGGVDKGASSGAGGVAARLPSPSPSGGGAGGMACLSRKVSVFFCVEVVVVVVVWWRGGWGLFVAVFRCCSWALLYFCMFFRYLYFFLFLREAFKKQPARCYPNVM